MLEFLVPLGARAEALRGDPGPLFPTLSQGAGWEGLREAADSHVYPNMGNTVSRELETHRLGLQRASNIHILYIYI